MENSWAICPVGHTESATADLWTGGLGKRVVRRRRRTITHARRRQRPVRLRAQKRARLRAKPLYRTFLQQTCGRLRLCGRDGSTLPPLPLPLRATSPRIPLHSSVMLAPLRVATQEAARECHFSTAQTYDLVLAVGEAATNALVHAGGGEARVRADVDAGVIQVWIQDSGPGISTDHLRRAIRSGGFSTAGTLGQGFRIMLRACDRLFIQAGNDIGTSITLVQAIRASECQRRRAQGFSL